MGLFDMLHRSGAQRPRFPRSSSKDSSRSRSDSDDDCSAAAPNVDAYLDNTVPEEYFKLDLLRLVHKLRIHGWSIVREDMSSDIEVVRICGATTNAVYRIHPPSYIKERVKHEFSGRSYYHRLPVDLLLRVYGLQAGQMIDREKELKVMQKLNAHKIGAKLLGTFENGRFEQLLNAKPLTKDDLRNPETSIQISKRMRDLHDHIQLDPGQREEGPGVLCNLEQWKPIVVARLERLELNEPGYTKALIGRSLEELLEAIDEYKAWLVAQNGPEFFQDLVFCHNDTQYGNILRVEPPKGSPLLMPQNEHRRLVVIDFEYAAQNHRAFDIANHFCEWMCDYHHPTSSYHLWLERFPSEEEQLRFLSGYVEQNAPELCEMIIDPQVATLKRHVKEWLPACSVQWAFWGVIQAPEDVEAKIALLERTFSSSLSIKDWSEDIAADKQDGGEIDEHAFDCLKFSQEKFALFWSQWDDLKSSS